ncbi:YsnF/AvaK domain-containing protein [Sandarakinorhabdus sp. DWP1-3-1]|uniref:YsnF/AvaK domain-containing protein n=1 Tax=Sandarakinorhabdus sp. DWP1-3-1 TaxID=2804627 RepID=UPI003CE81A5F
MPTSPPIDRPEPAVIPLVEEELQVDKRAVETGRVRVHVRNDHHDVRVREELVRGNVDIERVTIDRRIDAVPDIQDLGHTIIIPIVEEVLVVEKRLMLREEIHIRRRARVDSHEETVTLTRQRAVVERVDSGTKPVSPNSKDI